MSVSTRSAIIVSGRGFGVADCKIAATESLLHVSTTISTTVAKAVGGRSPSSGMNGLNTRATS